MIEILPFGEQTAEKESDEYIEEDYTRRKHLIIRPPENFEDDCELIIEYIDDPDKDFKTVPEDIYEIGVRSIFSDELIGRITKFKLEKYTFESTNGRLVKIYVLESVPKLSRLLSTNANREKERQQLLRLEEFQGEWEDILPKLSTAARHKTKNVSVSSGEKENIGDEEKSLGEGWADLGMTHKREIHPDVVPRAYVEKGPENRVPIVRGMVLYKVNREGNIRIRDLQHMVSRAFGVRDKTAKLYIRKLDEWCDDVSVRSGIVSI